MQTSFADLGDFPFPCPLDFGNFRGDPYLFSCPHRDANHPLLFQIEKDCFFLPPSLYDFDPVCGRSPEGANFLSIQGTIPSQAELSGGARDLTAFPSMGRFKVRTPGIRIHGGLFWLVLFPPPLLVSLIPTTSPPRCVRKVAFFNFGFLPET